MTCGACAHWTQTAEEVTLGPNNIPVPVIGGRKVGECRRYPPDIVATDRGPLTIYKQTDAPFPCCGEFKERPVPILNLTPADLDRIADDTCTS